jgi:hypothetical protein
MIFHLQIIRYALISSKNLSKLIFIQSTILIIQHYKENRLKRGVLNYGKKTLFCRKLRYSNSKKSVLKTIVNIIHNKLIIKDFQENRLKTFLGSTWLSIYYKLVSLVFKIDFLWGGIHDRKFFREYLVWKIR